MNVTEMRGVYPALITPFSEGGELVDLDAVGAMTGRLVNQGVAGLFICGTTGQGANLSANEKLAILRETLNAVDGRCEVWIQAGCGEWIGTRKVIDEAQKIGVTGLSLIQPWFYALDEDAQVQYIARAAERVEDVPLYLYNIPQNSGNHLSETVVQRSLDRFNVIRGVKESASPAAIRRWLPMRNERFHVTCGVDTEFCALLREGVDASVTSFGNILSPFMVKMREAAHAGDWTRADALRRETILPVIEALDNSNLYASLMYALSLMGLPHGRVRPPLRELTGAEKKRVETVVEKFELK
ncbi:MAG: hypothetical protein GC154_07895 [bacterium]|nr:hypothetical protein [bacterium]